MASSKKKKKEEFEYPVEYSPEVLEAVQKELEELPF